jgi:hypothetical protein
MQGALGPRLIVKERPDVACGRSRRRLNLDDLGAEASEGHPDILCAFVGNLDHAQAI